MCGYEYTNKLQRMFQDMTVSKNLNDKFKKQITNQDAEGKINIKKQKSL